MLKLNVFQICLVLEKVVPTKPYLICIHRGMIQWINAEEFLFLAVEYFALRYYFAIKLSKIRKWDVIWFEMQGSFQQIRTPDRLGMTNCRQSEKSFLLLPPANRVSERFVYFHQLASQRVFCSSVSLGPGNFEHQLLCYFIFFMHVSR